MTDGGVNLSFGNYIYEKLLMIILNLFCAAALTIYLRLLGNSLPAAIPILAVWFFILAAVIMKGFFTLRNKAQLLNNQLDMLDQKYLICEMLEKPENGLEKLYQLTLRTANKSMLENVNKIRNAQRDYKEYIEEWIHEIKTPITAVDLICKNHPDPENTRISRELAQINYLVEQALYYARSENVEKDYFIKEFSLSDALAPALMQNRTVLLEEKISLSIDENDTPVCTDEKWLTYILSQILTNSIKYRSPHNPSIHIYSTSTGSGVYLTVEDNGQGISPEDLPRIFEKGFTGSCRNNRKSTGMGLYLCKKLCQKLGLTISADSVLNQGTKITIGFPVGALPHPERRE